MPEDSILPEDEMSPEDEIDFGDEMEKLGEELEAELKEAGEDILSDLAGAGDGLIADAEDAILDKAEEILGEGVEDIPDISESGRADRSLDMTMRYATGLLKEQARVAIASLAAASKEAAEQGSEILSQITQVGQMVAAGQLRHEDGEIAVDNFMEALELIGKRLENEAKVQAYERGQALLASAKSVAFSLLKAGVQISTAKAEGWISGLVLTPEQA